MPSELILPIPRSKAGKHSADNFGPWAIEPGFFQAATSGISEAKVKPTARQGLFDDDSDDDDTSDQPAYVVRNGVAIITIEGVMTKFGSWWYGGCATVEVRAAVRAATADRSVKAILMHICSPGGTVAGNADLAEDVAAAAAAKPTDAYIADTGCSAAYWIASQCRNITANVTAMVGCIGTYMVLRDSTGLQDQIGIKYTVISTADYKGLGADGKVTDTLVADMQREVNELNIPFLAGVSAGRGDRIADVAAVADGRSHIAAQAVTLGLIDNVASLDAAMAALTKEIKTMTLEEFLAYGKANPDATKQFKDEGFAAGKAAGVTEGAAAEQTRFKALSDKYGKERPGFVVEQFGKGNDVAKASVDLADVLMTENASLKEQIAKGPKAAPPSQKQNERPTQQPLAEDGSESEGEADHAAAGKDAAERVASRIGGRRKPAAK